MASGPSPFTSRASGFVMPGGQPSGLQATNFKAIAAVDIPDVRLTVVTGSNSSGKSSLLQAMLFLAQSVGQATPVINGDLVRLGEPRDVIRDGTSAVSLAVSFSEPVPDGPPLQVTSQVFLRAEQQLLQPSEFTLHSADKVLLRATASDVSAKIRKRVLATEVPLRLEDADALGFSGEAYLTMVGVLPGRVMYRASKENYRQTFAALSKDPNFPFYVDQIFRMRQWPTQDVSEDISRKLAEFRHRAYHPNEWQFSQPELDALFEMYFEVDAPDGWASEPVTVNVAGAPRSPGLPRIRHAEAATTLGRLANTASVMHQYAARVVYLGPLRDDPRVAYPLGHTVTNLPVGEKGEFTAAYLDQHGDRVIQYQTPEGVTRYSPLRSAVSEWCQHLGIADTVNVELRGKLGHELQLQIFGHERDPTAVGVGASQLVPVVVLVLGAPPNSIVLLEQPELHLHPKVQSRLGDFFAWARQDVSLIVETHSEYLVTRLRLRVAEGRLPADSIAILFARQQVVEHLIFDGDNEGVDLEVFSEFRRLNLDTRGDFDAWPEGFFDTLGNDSVALAKAISARLDAERTE